MSLTQRLVYYLQPYDGHRDQKGPVLGPFPGPLHCIYENIMLGDYVVACYTASGVYCVYDRQSNNKLFPVREPVMRKEGAPAWQDLWWSDLHVWAEAQEVSG